MKKPDLSLLAALAVVLLAALWKLAFLLSGVIQFNSDEAVVALMARHILQGERPVFFYGQAYMGSLDAWVVAGAFALFGESVTAIRVVQLVLYLGILATTIWMARLVFDGWAPALTAGLLLAVPTVNVTLYTTASLGGYGEALLLGNLQLLIAFHLYKQILDGRFTYRPLPWLLWGFCAGLGLWANGLTLVFTAPSGLLLLWLLFRRGNPFSDRQAFASLGWIAAGLLAGAAPWWVYALQQGPARLLGELGGGAVAVEGQTWLVRTATHLVSLVLLGCTALFGLRPPWEVRWLALPLLPLALAFWLVVVSFLARRALRRNPSRPVYEVLFGVVLVLVAGFLFTPFGVDPSGRYFLPLSVPLALAAGKLVTLLPVRPRWAAALVAGVLVFQGWGTVQSALRFPPGLTTQFYAPSQIDHRYDAELARFLLENGETRGYSSYWVTYPLAFHSNEQLVFSPELPYHNDLSYTPRDNRYAPYAEQASASLKTAYINTTPLPEVTEGLRSGLHRLGIRWQEQQIGDYIVFYRLSRPVRPAELGFGAEALAEKAQP